MIAICRPVSSAAARHSALLCGIAALSLMSVEPARAGCSDNPGPRIDWTGCSKARRMLAGDDFTGSIFTKAALGASDFAGSVLKGAKLNETEVTRTRFEGANLSQADFTKAVGWRANFVNANLSKAVLHAADMSRSDFTKANLTGANLSKSELNRSDFSGADLTGADLSRAELARVIFTNAKLAGVNFSFSNLAGQSRACRSQGRGPDASLSPPDPICRRQPRRRQGTCPGTDRSCVRRCEHEAAGGIDRAQDLALPCRARLVWREFTPARVPMR